MFWNIENCINLAPVTLNQMFWIYMHMVYVFIIYSLWAVKILSLESFVGFAINCFVATKVKIVRSNYVYPRSSDSMRAHGKNWACLICLSFEFFGLYRIIYTLIISTIKTTKYRFDCFLSNHWISLWCYWKF